jgi:hypothetical protein
MDAHLQSMSSIYAKATVTIVAAVGRDADYGLPGIVEPSRRRDRNIDVEGPKQTTWSRHAWTFQELIFSRRRIIFTAREVIWECRTNYVA